MKRKNESDQSNAFIKDILLKVFALKYLYIVCIVVFISAAYLYNKYSTKVYEAYTTIGPVKDDRTEILSSNGMFQGLNGYSQRRNIENDINNLSSFSLVSATISQLNLEVGYFRRQRKFFKQTTELYRESPFTVNIDKSHVQPINTRFNVLIINDSSFRLTAMEEEASLYNYIDNQVVSDYNLLVIDTICSFNETISNKNFKFSVSLHKDHLPVKQNLKDLYYFEFYHLDFITKQYLKKIIISPLSPLSSIINIQFSGENIEKTLYFLNKYVDYYIKENLAEKNKIAVSTINFIDSQISNISDSLVLSESKLRNFKSANQVTDLSLQGQRLYTQLSQIETERASLEIQERYYNYVINYFKTNIDMSGVVPPSSMNVTDPIMNQFITDLLSLNAQRAEILSNKNEKNLFLGQLENKIKMQKDAIIENVTNNLNTLNLSLNELKYRSDKLSTEISNLPRTELNMVSMQRKFKMDDAIYTYLLQKRSEAAITLASNYPDYELLEPAREITSQVKKPKVMTNYMISFFLAMLIPTMILFIRVFFNDKIGSVADIEQLLDRPVIGTIYSNTKKTESVVAEYPGSSIAESFRNLRSSIFSKLKVEKSNLILVTSSQPQDGKSFVSFNLASSIAAVGYKTIVIDCDLRRPVLHNKFKEDNLLGVSSFMVNHVSVEEIIRKSSIENLSYIPGGPILPNPSELIAAGVLDDLINFLKSKYDYVIIDAAPIGIVADTIQLMKYANQILMISRFNYTRKNMLADALESLNSNNINNFDVVFNDLNIKKSSYSSYTNYYVKE
jgi:tyrosine-protein kinase Etk/Wzc